MAQIPTSSITMAQIKAETGASATGTLDQCRVASNAYTMTSTSVPGHTRDGTEQTNTNAANWNNTMAEWAGYTHSVSLGTIVYNIRFVTADPTWPTAGWGLYETADGWSNYLPDNQSEDGGIYLYTVASGSNTLIRADRLKNGDLDENDGPNVGRHYPGVGYNSFGSQTTNDGTGAVTIITIPVVGDNNTALTVTAVRNAISGQVTGKDDPTGKQSGATYITNTSAGAYEVQDEGGWGIESQGVFRLKLTVPQQTLTVSGSPVTYEATELDGGTAGAEISVFSFHGAYSVEDQN